MKRTKEDKKLDEAFVKAYDVETGKQRTIENVIATLYDATASYAQEMRIQYMLHTDEAYAMRNDIYDAVVMIINCTTQLKELDDEVRTDS